MREKLKKNVTALLGLVMVSVVFAGQPAEAITIFPEKDLVEGYNTFNERAGDEQLSGELDMPTDDEVHTLVDTRFLVARGTQGPEWNYILGFGSQLATGTVVATEAFDMILFNPLEVPTGNKVTVDLFINPIGDWGVDDENFPWHKVALGFETTVVEGVYVPDTPGGGTGGGDGHAAVPVPPALSLLGAALAGLGLMARRRRS